MVKRANIWSAKRVVIGGNYKRKDSCEVRSSDSPSVGQTDRLTDPQCDVWQVLQNNEEQQEENRRASRDEKRGRSEKEKGKKAEGNLGRKSEGTN
jgi:hypothetical protein